MVDGKRYRITLPYKPSKKEAYQLIQDKASGRDKLKQTFKQCAREYIDSKKHILSPSTVKGYESLYRTITDFDDKPIGTISGIEIQRYIDRLTQEKSPKTVRNIHSFISAVFKAFSPQTVIYTNLPRKAEKQQYNPSDDDIKRILSEAKGTKYEIPLRLACYGLRRSEVCAITADDIEGNTVSITKAVLQNTDKEFVVWHTKTESSNRKVIIDQELADMIKEKGYAFNESPDRIHKYLTRVQNRLGIPHFKLHYFRHYFASTMHDLGVPDAAIMEAGGWKTDHVMKEIYRYGKNVSEQQQKMVEHVGNLVGNCGQ